ncbi:F0F1 ATP synthase subunit A [Seonamhaeicola maritimus]|uniref:ATP synthase subunit a n=1 Tax=Seonamhaeicola maritimus TaxID=2591822 RepID=A0A5C7GHR7_9FLAO|nr:F0F1 ATP synthase subunit A [Seonamhaeicola maritimus]TXG37124.1 F0F1 ATP synthase subunit A [Seonamhaeicola maritimus]
MRRKIAFKPITLLLFLITFMSFGKEDNQHGESGSDLRTEIKEYVQHHLLDSYDFNLFSYENGEKHFGFPLPVILWDNGLKVFLSSKFHHGETVAEAGGSYYKQFHGKIYNVDGPNGEIIEDDHHHATNAKPLDFSITKNVVLIMMVFAIMFFMFSRMAKTYKKNNGMPKGMGRFLEPIVLYVRDEIAIPNIGEKKYKRYMSYLLTVFFFVWIVNLFGLTPIGMNVTNNIAVTLCLALITYFITTFSGNKNYWKHIFWMPGVPVPMKIILAPIELLGTIIKPFALMIRLYANITAGHVVLMSIIGMMFIFNNWLGSSLSFVLAFVLGILELLVAALQAYIFTVLSALYFGMAVEDHDHH